MEGTELGLTIYAAGNVLVWTGYAFIGLFVARGIGLVSWWGRAAAVIFFVTCALTHLDKFVHAMTREAVTVFDMASSFHLMNSAVQGVSVWVLISAVVYERSVLRGEWPPNIDFFRPRRRDDRS